MKAGLTVVGACLVVSVMLAVYQYRLFKTDLVATQDLFLGLLYFMEANEGRMPATEHEFLASPFVTRGEDGAYRIVAPEITRFNRRTHGYPIHDLEPFRINWGCDLTTLQPNEYGRLLNPAGENVELIRWPSSGESGKVYSLMLFEQAPQLRESATN